MTYIKTVEVGEAQGILKKLYEGIEKNMGFVPSFLKVMGHRPDVLEAFLPVYQRLMHEEHELKQGAKELLICYVCTLNSCEYCMIPHVAMAMSAFGYSEDEIRGILKDVGGSTLIDGRQKAMFGFAEKVTRCAEKVTALDIESLREQGFSDAAITEMLLVIAFYNLMNRFSLTIGAPVKEVREAFFGKKRAKGRTG